jgi:hypothetical protein
MPEMAESQRIAKVTEIRGNGIFSCAFAEELEFGNERIFELLVSLPSKFKNLLWVKRGVYPLNALELSNG